MKRATAHSLTAARNGPRLTEPLWPPFVAMVAVSGLYTVLTSYLLRGLPRWLPAAIVIGLLIPIVITHHRGNHWFNQRLGYVLNSLVTGAMIFSLALLVAEITKKRVTPVPLLWSAAVLWLSNILVFAAWYWRLDGGGPHARRLTPKHTDGAFLFPQMTMHPEA